MQIGVIGLGRMGGNISVRLARHGHEVVVYDRDPGTVSKVHERAERSAPATGIEDMVGKLSAPRVVWVMLPAGAITEQTVELLSGLLSKGDIIIDGGNSFYKDDIRRARTLREKGIHYVDVGTSGGVWGLERGYCMMIGGSKEAVDHVDPILSACARDRRHRPHPEPHLQSRSSRRAGLPALRRGRFRAFRQDGA